MNNMIKLPAIVLGLLLLLTGSTQQVMAQDEEVSLQSFYDELSPYGTWIQDPQYGYVWRPDVDQGDFRPYYTNGRWVMTEYGNTWVSNYDWGWAPFHYGRWVYNRYNQWIWIPDTVWGPAWVSWRSGGGYYGWAPLGPGMHVNVNINIPSLWWVFVPHRNIYYDSFPRYYSRRNVTIINRTTIINNTYVRNSRTYYSGPRAAEIRRYTGRDVDVYSVNRTSRPGRSGITGRSLEVYTPSRSSRDNGRTAAAPRTSVRGEGYTAARPDRSTRIEGGEGSSRPQGRETISRDNDRSGRSVEGRSAEGRVSRNRNNEVQESRPQPAEQPRVMRPTPNESQPAPQRIERPSRQERQPQAQPQRQERRVEPRQQAQPQRIERTAPSRNSESRGSQQGGGREQSSRSSRGGRG
ncbi:DUF6600 domain-containing protein [Pedobacter faecalis]|uniref:DUF6600 domain-containing protein n=1 Tax=Pedobacter faecalis TaxID=3041495 RepID=UPI002550246B|nr:DUF6600 domain-containing protein [Pedobacter sp. ELA7]